jgi:C1A family cysteine protease
MIDATKYKFNLQKSPDDPRDYLLETIYPDTVTLPEKWDLRKNMRQVRDQGDQGTCSAQTAAAMKECQEESDVKFKYYMSPQFVYNLRTNQGSEGMYPRDTMEILYKIGIVPENNYPYGTFKPIGEGLKEIAAKYKIQGYAQVNTIDSLKKALFANGPCYIAFPVYNPNKMEFWKPDFTGQQTMGGHAVTVAGYLRDKFIIRNSWSVQWGDAGYCYYSFSDFGMHWEIWTAIDADSNPQTLYNKTSKYSMKKSFFKRMWPKK